MTKKPAPRALTKRERRHLSGYLRDLADELNLRDWVIVLLHDPVPMSDPALASARITYGRHSVSIDFDVGVVRGDPQLLREICIHELLHVHIPARVPLYGVDELIGRPAALVYAETLNERYERATDAIANAIAPKFPLPPSELQRH